MKIKLPSIQQVFKASSGTFFRFPIAIIDAVAGTLAALVLIDFEGPPGPTIFFNILFAAITGIPLFMAIVLVTEKKNFTKPISFGLHVIGLLALAGYGYTIPSDIIGAPAIHLFRMLIIAIALHLFVAIAPFAGRGEANGFWQYNKILLQRILIALFYSGIMYLGLALAMGALNNLFGINIPGKRYFELWVLILGIFNTWFFLAGVPEKLSELENVTDYPKGLKIFVQSILFPLVVIYLVILYAYLGKILIAWALPQGWVGRLIIGYAATGIFSLLLLHPIRDQLENVWIRRGSRWFYAVLIPLILTLFLALGRRIADYGFTELRFIGVVLALWLLGITCYYIFKKNAGIKIIPASLCVLSFGISFGPWGMFAVSESSQIGRLREILSRNSILVNGMIEKKERTIAQDDRKQISSIVSYLHDLHGYDRIQPWFRESLKEDPKSGPWGYKEAPVVIAMMGIDYDRTWQVQTFDNKFLLSDPERSFSIAGYDHALPSQYFSAAGGHSIEKKFPDDRITYRLPPTLDSISIVFKNDDNRTDSLQTSFHPLIDSLLKEFPGASDKIDPAKMSLDLTTPNLKVKIYLQQIRLHQEGNAMKPTFVELSIFYGKQ
ncbi:MAG: DUF4153 domain-containing protein [Bacteroidota bacterium]